jgi:hypothetical protein
MPHTRQVRAHYTDDTVRVYQAYSPAIALPALRAQTFVPPFRLTRMTWIKPSFLWMMYRSDWARRSGQEHILQIELSRKGFDWCLAQGILTSFDAAAPHTRADWQRARQQTPVLVQWDPERDLLLRPLSHRAIQIGLRHLAVEQYVDQWITRITDVTDVARRICRRVEADDIDGARALLPREETYAVGEAATRRLGMTPAPVS